VGKSKDGVQKGILLINIGGKMRFFSKAIFEKSVYRDAQK
jgi:hypothetical protein